MYTSFYKGDLLCHIRWVSQMSKNLIFASRTLLFSPPSLLSLFTHAYQFCTFWMSLFSHASYQRFYKFLPNWKLQSNKLDKCLISCIGQMVMFSLHQSSTVILCACIHPWAGLDFLSLAKWIISYLYILTLIIGEVKI